MTLLSALFFSLVAASSAGEDMVADALLCQGEAVSIYLPGNEGTPAPNISLIEFQYRSDDDPCARNIDHDELMRLHSAVKTITDASFATSKKSFWVMVKYTLTPNSPTTLEMKASVPQSGNKDLGSYYDKAVKLTDYHSSKGAVEVLFHYEVSPSSSKNGARSDGNGD